MGSIVSLIEGGKGIVRPKERALSGHPPDSKAAILARIEGEIANFDKDQRLAAITLVDGPQRIRGLAGSGKTIVLAMKAAHIHLDNPRASVLFTFWTRSLYDLAKQHITRFYRQFDDRDPDWTQLHVLHAWGGRRLEGVYYNACRENGRMPLTLQQAQRAGSDPFSHSSSTPHSANLLIIAKFADAPQECGTRELVVVVGQGHHGRLSCICLITGGIATPAAWKTRVQIGFGSERSRNVLD